MPSGSAATPSSAPSPPRERDSEALYARRVNAKWVRLLSVLGMNVEYDRCAGTSLWTRDGRRILDFLSGYGVYNAGHNHPDIVAALEAELARPGARMLQSHVPALAAELADRLCVKAGGGLEKVFFTSTGSEGVETAIKFARAHTRRPGIVYARGSFHGLTMGALSLMGDPWWREGFGPFLPGTVEVSFGDLEALETVLKKEETAAVILEPIQAEAGIVLPPEGYLARAEALCRKHGALFVLDEVQTGLHRTGPFLAAHRYGVQPDMVVLAKALSGGLVPVGAVLMTDAVHASIFNTLSRSFIHASTFGENDLAMRAGLASLEVFEKEKLGERSERMGARLRAALRERLAGFEMVAEVRGAGLLGGVVFQPPAGLKLKMMYGAFRKIHKGMFGQMVVAELFRKHGILTQVCGNDHLVLKINPPLILEDAEADAFVEAVAGVVAHIHQGLGFWTGALSMAKGVVA